MIDIDIDESINLSSKISWFSVQSCVLKPGKKHINPSRYQIFCGKSQHLKSLIFGPGKIQVPVPEDEDGRKVGW